MGNAEFYKQKASPQEDLDRLKKIEYPNFVSESVLSNFLLKGKKVLDSGSGPNAGLAEYVAHQGGMYVPLELRADALASMQDTLNAEGVPFYGVRGDARKIPFDNETFDIVHQRFVFMNIAPETRVAALQELLRVGKKDFVFLEYNWRTLASTESPEVIERFRELMFEAFSRFSIDPYMGEKFADMFEAANPALKYDVRHFRRKESLENNTELIMSMRGMGDVVKNVLHDAELAEKFKELAEELERDPIAFEPPEIVVATLTGKESAGED